MALSQVTRSVLALRLDPDNVRLSPDLERKPLHILSEMWDLDDVEDMIRSIVDRGFLPLDSIFITKEGDYFVVVEGNRRVAACKLIVDPSKIGPVVEKRVRRILRTNPAFDPNSVAKLACWFADDREELIPIMITKHMGRSFRPWNEWLRNRYYLEQLESVDGNYEDAAKLLKINRSDIVDAVKMNQMYRLSMKVADPDTKLYLLDRSSFAPTTFARLYDSSFVRGTLLFEFDANGLLVTTTKIDQLEVAWGYLVKSLASGSITSRTFNSENDQREWWEKNFPDELEPTADHVENPTMVHNAEEDSPVPDKPKPDNTPDQEQTTRRPRRPRRHQGLIRLTFPNCEWFDPRVDAVAFELKRLPFRKFPNLAAIGMRCLFDLTLISYFHRDKKRWGAFMKKYVEEQQSKNSNYQLPKQFTPNSSDLIAALITDPTEFGINGSLSKALVALKSTHVFFTLNNFMHNPKMLAVEGTVEEIWKQLDPVICELLTSDKDKDDEQPQP
jgi:hypothetical protein